MNRQMWCGSVAILALLAFGAMANAEVKVQPDKDNVVASRLEGKWELEPELVKRLGQQEHGTLSFKSDPTVAAKIPAKYDTFLADKRVYMAGVMTRAGKEHPFLLIEYKGNPYIVYFREREGDPMGDSESFNVMLAVAKETANDLLFIGGDFNNQPFTAFRRVQADGK